MARKKRARITARSPSPPAPLGSSSLSVHPAKSKEEIELEEAVFGRAAFVGAAGGIGGGKKGKRRGAWEDEDDVVGGRGGGAGMGHLQDQDLFFVDAPTTNGYDDDQADPDSDDDPSSASSSSEADDEASRPTRTHTLTTHTKPAWSDPSSSHAINLLTGPSRLRKLRANPHESLIPPSLYEARLRSEFERGRPEPLWVGRARRAKRGREEKDNDGEGEGEGEGDGLEEAMRSASALGFDARKVGRSLPSGTIDISRLRDVPIPSDPTPSSISSIAFHPLPSCPLFFSSSPTSRCLHLFRTSTSGKEWSLLRTVKVPELPVDKAAFEPSQGRSVFLAGSRPFFYTYDLASDRCLKSSPRGLLGVEGGGQGQSEGRGGSYAGFEFSPDGTRVAVPGRRGYVNFLDFSPSSSSGGGGGRSSQVIQSIKINSPVKGVAWKGGGGGGGKEVLTLGEGGEVGVWDLRMGKECVGRWRDEGGYGAESITSHSRWTGIGSKSGIVNLYHGDQGQGMQGEERKATKTVDRLKTAVGAVRFHPGGEVVALGSRVKKDQLKLVHLPSGTVFSNWPTSATPLGHVYDVAFSPDGGRMAVGNGRGRVGVWGLGWWSKSKK